MWLMYVMRDVINNIYEPFPHLPVKVANYQTQNTYTVVSVN